MKIKRLILAAVIFLSVNHIAIAQDSTISDGGICVQTNRENLPRLDQLFRSEGGLIRRTAQSELCPGAGYQSYTVPVGLERWAIERASRIPYVEKATTMGDTAGGPGEARTPLPIGTIFSVAVTPQNLEETQQEFECKVKTQLQKRFTDVDMQHCQLREGVKPGICVLTWLGGNTSDGAGFSTLRTNLGSSIWLSAVVLIEAASFPGFERLFTVTQRMKLASGNASQRPAAAEYHELKGDDADELPSVLSDYVDKILTSKRMNCGD
jgi:hypothetical protein